MDGHLLRRLAQDLEPVLENARLEKIKSPGPNVYIFSFYTRKGKFHLCLRYGRQHNFLFLASRSVPTNTPADAKVMLLRKYFQGRRLRKILVQPFARRVWMLFFTRESCDVPETRLAWLLLDLRDGVHLEERLVDETPSEECPIWPDVGGIADALVRWREWPVMTPDLRKTLALLDDYDARALLSDLREGGGDIFLYSDAESGRICHVSAWPLPRDLRGTWQEHIADLALNALDEAGNQVVFGELLKQEESAFDVARKRQLKKLEKRKALLDAEEERLLRFCAARENAIYLQNNLWKMDKDAKCSEISIQDENRKFVIQLDKRFSIVENMKRLFATANKGKRGLVYLQERRAKLEEDRKNIDQLVYASFKVDTEQKSKIKKDPEKILRYIEKFISSDGFVILRGSNAKGNIICRKIAQGHDMWLHVTNGPGSHVVIRKLWPNQQIPSQTMIEAGILASCKSWQKDAAYAEIEATELRYIKTIRGDTSGKVLLDKIFTTYTVKVDHDLINTLRRA
ncbi:MAG: NFACT RNA binding domain-containing protein [Desulfovibrio sp.]|nr:NFACT RNA binding domain-containing protein [Desulfovibrio sp.]